tara:strand:+ start:870 stop:1163 length:294 start_codon:yes stop_codon:yes gene_type:complete
MKAGRKIVLAFTDLIEGQHLLEPGGWLDFYTYEPIESGKAELRKVIEALKSLAGEGDMPWEFRLMASDGMITTNADGSYPAYGDGTSVSIFEGKFAC